MHAYAGSVARQVYATEGQLKLCGVASLRGTYIPV